LIVAAKQIADRWVRGGFVTADRSAPPVFGLGQFIKSPGIHIILRASLEAIVPHIGWAFTDDRITLLQPISVSTQAAFFLRQKRKYHDMSVACPVTGRVVIFASIGEY
jgi:hypothetical protein